MNVRYRVELSQAERWELTAMLSKGKRAARKLKRAQILLAADAGHSDEEIARTVAVGGSTVYRTKRRFVEGNLERALSEDPRPGAERRTHQMDVHNRKSPRQNGPRLSRHVQRAKITVLRYAISRLAADVAGLTADQPSLAKRVKAAAPKPNGYSARELRLGKQKYRKQPHAKKGTP
jgi:transposase